MDNLELRQWIAQQLADAEAVNVPNYGPEWFYSKKKKALYKANYNPTPVKPFPQVDPMEALKQKSRVIMSEKFKNFKF